MKIRNYLLLFFTFFLSFISEADPTDSLRIVMENTRDIPTKVDLLNQISWEYNRSDLLLTKEYAQQALALSEKYNYEKGRARAYNLIAIVETRFGNDGKAIKHNKQSLEIGEKINDAETISKATNDLGNLYAYAGKHDVALKYYQRSLTIAKKEKNILGISFTYYNIGLIHEELRNKEQAIHYYEKSIEIGLKSDDPIVLSGAHSNKGLVNSLKKNYDEAIKNGKKALEYAEKANDKWSIGYAYLNIGYYHKKKKELDLAKSYYEKGLKISTELGEKGMIGGARSSLAGIYNDKKEFDKAIYHGEIAQSIYQSFEVEDTSTWFLNKLLAESYAGMKNFEKAYELMQEYNVLRDTILSKDSRKTIADLETNFRINEKEVENKFLKEKNKKNEQLAKQQRIINFIIILLLISVGIVAAVIYYASQQRKKNIDILEEKVAERTKSLEATNASLERFNYIASHDLKEPLRSISSFTVLLDRHLDTEDEVTLKYMDFIKRNSNRMYELVGAMLEVSRYKRIIPNFENINTNHLINEVKEGLSKYIHERNATIQIDKLPSVNADAALLSIVIQNIIFNGIKYNESKIPQIHITTETVGNEIIFNFKDNGIGIDEAYQKQIFEAFKRLHHYGKYSGTGIGLFISNDIVGLHNGRIWVETNPKGGSIFKIAFPK